MSGVELIEKCQLNFEDIDLQAKQTKSIPSPEMTVEDIREISKMIIKAIEEGIDGIVLTHGTDTMEETAYMIDLLIDTRVPIIFTGSQRNIEDLGFDGAANLRDAVITAADDSSKGKGVLVVFNQEIYPAKDVTKMNTTGLGGFQSASTGPLGVVYGEKVNYYYDYKPKEKFEVDDASFSNNVYLFKMTLDFPVHIVEKIIDDDCDGLVIEGFGVGEIVPDLQDLLEKVIDKGVPVILVSRSLTGGIRKVYGTKGTPVQLEQIGVILDEGSLSGPKARLKLIAMLNSPYKNQIAKYWNRY